MDKVALTIIIMLIITLSASPHAPTTRSTTSLLIGIDQGHKNLHVNSSELSGVATLMNSSGVHIVYTTGTINTSFLNSVNLLLISTPTSNFTSQELQTLDSWYATGGKIWISASPESGASIDFLNAILHALRSGLAFERAYTQDPLFNLNATSSDSDRLIVPIINQKEGLSNGLTLNVRRIYGFRPVPVLSYQAGTYSRYDELKSPNSIWLAKTVGTSRANNITGTTPIAYVKGEAAEFPLVTVEESGSGKLAITGFPVFSSQMGQFTYIPEHPYDNKILVKNLMRWLAGIQTSGELEGSIPLLRATNHPTVMLYIGSRSQHVNEVERGQLFSLLSDMGFNIQTLDSLQNAQLKNASALIIQTPNQLISSNDTDALKTWMKTGDKLLILASMADYSLSTSATQSLALNDVMKDLGATLRFEQGSMYDYEVNLGGDPYFALASDINHSTGILGLTRNVRSLFMQFSTILAGWNGTDFVPLENQTYLAKQTNITWIARSSNNSVVFDLDTVFPLRAHAEGQKGSYITAAVERYNMNDRIVLVGGPIFSNFSLLLNYPTVFGYPVDNRLFIRNMFATLITQSETLTNIDASASPTEIPEGAFVTLNINYNYLQTSLTNLSDIEKIPVTPANITASLGTTTPTTQKLPNGTYLATASPTGTGTLSWSVSASAAAYQSKSTSGTFKVNPLPTRFTLYVLTIPLVIFIAVTIAVTARKAR